MNLFSLDASPFARKARILIKALKLDEQVQIVSPGTVTPVSNNDALNNQNPLGMIPVLVLDNGETLADSRVICEYLNEIGNGWFFPTEPSARFRALNLQSLADGILDLAVAVRYETAIRPAEHQWPEWINHQHQKINRALDRFETECDNFPEEPTIGEVTVACSLGYLDFRFPENDWRSNRPKLDQWYLSMMQRDPIATTVPA